MDNKNRAMYAKAVNVSAKNCAKKSTVRDNSNVHSDKRKYGRTMRRNGCTPLRKESAAPSRCNLNPNSNKHNCETIGAIDAVGTDEAQKPVKRNGGSPSRKQSPSPARANVNSDKRKFDRTMNRNGGSPLRIQSPSPARSNSNPNSDKHNCETIPVIDADGTDEWQKTLNINDSSPSRQQSSSPEPQPSTSKAASIGTKFSKQQLAYLKHQFDNMYADGLEMLDTLESCGKVKIATYKKIIKIGALCEEAIENESEIEPVTHKIFKILYEADFGHEAPSNNEQDLKPPDKTDM